MEAQSATFGTNAAPFPSDSGRLARQRMGYAVVAAAVAALLATIVAAPWLKTHGHALLSDALYHGFRQTCHQMPERSFWLFGAPLAVCSRCASIYAGAFAGVVAVPLLRGLRRPAPRLRWLLLACIPVGLDFGLGWLGAVENTFWSRGVTGLLVGAASAFYILPGLVEAIASIRGRGPAPSQGEVHGTE